LLWTHRDKLGVRVHAAHLNHLLRGADASADAQFVAQQAAGWGIPCTIESRNVRAYAREHRLALEEAARHQRYAFLAQVAQAQNARHIAVAHNADDQSETVLMHWLRGAGLAGLRGMLPATRLAALHIDGPAADHEGLMLIRPLLDTPRAEIERYCRQHNLSPRFDRSNLDTTLFRNKLRHELLPLLEREYKPGLPQILRRSARIIRDDYELLCTIRDRAWNEIAQQQTSDRAIILNRAAWRDLHPALQRATLRRAAHALRRDLRDVNYVHIQSAREIAQDGCTGDRATLPGGLHLVVGYETLTIADQDYLPEPGFPALPRPADDTPERFSLEVPGTTCLAALRAHVEIVPRTALDSAWEHNSDPWRAYLDASVLGSELALRRRRAGDCFHPLGMSGQSKLVSDLLINCKAPAEWRERIPLLVRADDSIMWVCGWRVDERARVQESTSQVAIVQLTVEE
jgi:tRNA(Ile)-lysidine synthase